MEKWSERKEAVCYPLLWPGQMETETLSLGLAMWSPSTNDRQGSTSDEGFQWGARMMAWLEYFQEKRSREKLESASAEMPFEEFGHKSQEWHGHSERGWEGKDTWVCAREAGAQDHMETREWVEKRPQEPGLPRGWTSRDEISPSGPGSSLCLWRIEASGSTGGRGVPLRAGQVMEPARLQTFYP